MANSPWLGMEPEPPEKPVRKKGFLAKALELPFLSRVSQIAKAGVRKKTSHGRAQNHEEAALDVWKATHGHGGQRPEVPKPSTRPAARPKAKAPPGKRGKAPRVQPRRPTIVIVEKQPPAQAPAAGGRPGHAPATGTPRNTPAAASRPQPGKPQPAAPPTPSPIINPFAGWSQKDVKDRIRQLLGDVEIPRFRKAVFETLRRLRDPDTTPEKVMEVMAVDAQLVGKVMQTVNSTAYSPRSKIQSLDHAIMLMGNADLERIVMLVGAKAALPSQTHPKFALSDFWKVSSRRAVLAREVADLVQPSKANLSFTAGFLQDLSVPLIVGSKKDDYMKIFNTALEEKRDLHVLEMDSMGWDHAEVGALVALDWELPDDVMLCLKDHNQPNAATRPDSAHYVSSLLPTHGEEWHDHFAAQIDQRYTVPREILDAICKDSVAKAADLAKLF